MFFFFASLVSGYADIGRQSGACEEKKKKGLFLEQFHLLRKPSKFEKMPRNCKKNQFFGPYK